VFNELEVPVFLIKLIVNNIVFSGMIVVVSIFISQLANSVISHKRRLSRKVLWKSNLIAMAISYGIWIGQIFIFGLLLRFFVPMVWHIVLMALFFGINWFFGKKLTKNEIRDSLIGLEERLNQKEEILKKMGNHLQKEKVLLDVQDLITYFYTEEGIVKAVEGVTFQIYEDEVLGLVGETGCGKSVTALSILQLIRPPGEIVGGKVIFQGIDLIKEDPEDMRKFRGDQITMIFQDPLNSLNPVMKVGDQIIEVYLNHKMDELYAEAGRYTQEIDIVKSKIESKQKSIDHFRENITETKDQMKEVNGLPDVSNNMKTVSRQESDLSVLLKDKKELKKERSELRVKSNIFTIARKWAADIIKDVGIADPERILDRYPHELSGGMRQRVMIAIGLACSPKLLIADEPTTALDVTIQAQILQLMKRLQKEYKTSILMITHDLGLISELCDRVAVMYSGYIVEYGSIFKLFKNPLHPYTHGLIRAIPRVEQRVDDLAIIPGMVPNLIYPPSGCRFHPRCDYCFEPCPDINPAQLETEEGYFVACHLYDPKYKDLAEKSRISVDTIKQEVI
jgi:peptide/nickel transport system ATP-binding protein